jgi:hypothetical protein
MSQDRHDPHEQEAAELAQHLAVVDVVGDLSGQAQARPDLLAEEAVAHPVAGPDAELLAFVALGLGELMTTEWDDSLPGRKTLAFASRIE